MIKPGTWRIAAFGDLSGQDKSFDPRRVRYLKNLVADLMDKNEAHSYENLSTCLRPVPPDDIPIVGPLKFFPNVYLNAGHAGRGTTLGLGTSKLLAELLMEGKSRIVEDATPYSPRRF
jgi:D-amino-acid dehydrogenase